MVSIFTYQNTDLSHINKGFEFLFLWKSV